MKRRQFLQCGLAASALVSLNPSICFASETEDHGSSVISLIYGSNWTQIGTIGRLIDYDDKVYCEHQDRLAHGMTMVIRSYAQAKADLASGKLAEKARSSEGYDKFLAHDGEGKLILVKELSDATKWTVGRGDGEPFKKYKTDRDDTIFGCTLKHAVGFNKKIYLGLAPEVETIKAVYSAKQVFERKVQQLVLAEKPDEKLALWVNDYSGK